MPPQDSSFTLDPAELQQRKSANARRVHAVQIPLVRLIGFAVLCFMAVINTPGSRQDDPALWALVAASLGYSLLSWAALWRFYGRTGRLDLSLLFMHLDLPMWLLTLHWLEQTHLFFGYLLLVRVADQVGYGFRRALYFSHVVVGAYLAYVLLLAALGLEAGRWGERLTLAAVMYLTGGYLAFTGFVTERLRLRTRTAVRTARQLVDKLEGKTCELEAQAHELRLARRMAEQASVAKSRFLAMMSHEIRTPMNGVLGATELLLGTPLSDDQRRYAETARQSGQVLLGIIDNVLDLSRIEAGRLELVTEPVDLRRLVDESMAVVRPQAHFKRLQLRAEVQPEVPDQVMADPLRLQQVLLNLLANAVKFTPQGEVTLRLGCGPAAAAARGGLQLVFEVEDTGIGISHAHRAHIFEPFVQADSSTTRRHGGSGLGLSIVRQLTRVMGGEIRVHSTPGQGSCFVVTLPVAPVPAPEAPPVEEEAAASEATLADAATGPQRCRVLLAEDNAVNQMVLREMLTRLQCEVDVVADGAQVTQAVRRQRYALVFMDCHMPGTDGFEAARSIRAAEARQPPGTRRLPIVALTAAAMPEDQAACRAAGMDDFLSKPVTMAQLSDMLARWAPDGSG
ncbi:ATP-binding protein [Aquincola tertiaricarbonis]|uniref:histidine kinase n=1 Tax=Aquincola tertiaricarbonis TaxID=391953 RepID=A0ABY4SAW5_AQUTE|nr:ATP-binding protein [Aquincola tertiaricarbonis]URI09206.1 ATP-binding protein [Aquincola tertiaricarbonis]